MTDHERLKFLKPSDKQHITLNSPFHYTTNFTVSHLADSWPWVTQLTEYESMVCFGHAIFQSCKLVYDEWMFLSSAWDQHLPPGFKENQPVLAHTLTLNLIIHPMSKKKQLFRAYTVQPLPYAMNSKSCSTQLTSLHTFCSSVGILCDLVIQWTVQQEEVIKNEIKPLALVCIPPGNCKEHCWEVQTY